MKRLAYTICAVIYMLLASHHSYSQGNQTVPNGGSTAPVNFPSSGCTYQWTNSNPAIGLPANGNGNILSFPAVNNGTSPVTATITVTPIPGVFAYITNSGNNTVSIINTVSQTVVATLIAGVSPFSTAITPDGSKVYIASLFSNSIFVINTNTNTVVNTITAPNNAFGIALSNDGTSLYVINQGLNTVSVINIATNVVTATITVGNSPYTIVISPDGSRAYVANMAGNDISVINTATNTVIATIGVGQNPKGIAVSPDGKTVYVTNTSSGSVSVINAVSNTVIATITAGQAPIGVTLSGDGSRLFVMDQKLGKVFVINTASYSIITSIPTDNGAFAGYLTPDGSSLYVTNAGADDVSIINTSTNSIVKTVPVGPIPRGLGGFFATGSCTATPFTFTITVNNSTASTITASAASGSISACIGSASSSPNVEQITVSGTGLTANITAVAPTGFEISLNANNGYGTSLTIPQSGGTANSTTIYVRSAASASGKISGNVVLSCPGATSQNVAVSGTVNALPTINTVPNQSLSTGASTTAVNFAGSGNTFTWTNNTPSIGLSGNGVGNIPPFTAINAGSNPVTATITVTPQSATFAYMVDSYNNNILAINTLTGATAYTIPTGKYPTGVSVSPDGSKVYITDQNPVGQGSVSVLSTSTYTIIATIPVGQNPWGIVVSPDGSRVYVANETSGTVSVINTSINAVISTIPVSKGVVGITITPDGSRVYVAGAYNGTANVTVINTSNNSVISNIPVGGSPFGITVSPDGSTVYVANAGTNSAQAISTATNTLIANIPLVNFPYDIVVSPDGSRLYVSNNYGDVISVIDARTNTVVGSIPSGQNPGGVSISPDGKELYVVDVNSHVINVYDTQTFTLLETINAGPLPETLGNFLIPGTGCAGSPITFTITVNSGPTPVVTTSTVTGTIAGCQGSPSSSPNVGQFTVAGTALTGDITVTPPAGFDISLTAVGGYSPSLTLKQVAGTVISTTIYVRSSASATGSISGNITVSTPGSTTAVPVNGIVNPLPSINPVANQTVNSGALTTAVNFTGTGNSFTWTNDTPSIGLPASGTGNIPPFTATNTTAGPITGTITVTPANSVTGCSGAPATYTITVDPAAPAISTGPLSGTISGCAGSPSTSPNIEQFTISGSNLAGNITVTAPAGFEVSADGKSFSNPWILVQQSGTVLTTTAYVRSSASAAGTIAGNTIFGNIILTSPGAADQTVTVTGTVYAGPTMNQPASQTVTAGQATAPVNFTGNAGFYTWTNDTPGIGLPANGMGNIPSFTAIDPEAAPAIATITVIPQSMSGVACNGTPTTFTITVNPAPTSFAASADLKGLVTIYGTPSASESFTISGTNLKDGVLVTPPSGFEVSTDKVSFSSAVTVGSVGNITPAPVYVRLAATTPAGNAYTGNIVLSASGTTNVDINMPNSVVNKAPLTITANNQSKPQGAPNPELTLTYTGFVNGDGPDQLTTQPVVTTIATASSAVGQYTITVNGATSTNYNITFVPGTLTVTPSLQYVTIPNAFTPNGDGINDFWDIPQLAYYPNCLVSIFTRYGNLVFQSRGYAKPWDGTRNGAQVPAGTYYYVIDPQQNGIGLLSGFVAVLR